MLSRSGVSHSLQPVVWGPPGFLSMGILQARILESAIFDVKAAGSFPSRILPESFYHLSKSQKANQNIPRKTYTRMK